jgi:hypothetical protein
MRLINILGFALLSGVGAENASDVVNLINPLWATPGGGNIASSLAASVVGVVRTPNCTHYLIQLM